MYIRKKYSSPYLVNKSKQLRATASCRYGSFSVSPVTLVALTANILPDLDLAYNTKPRNDNDLGSVL